MSDEPAARITISDVYRLLLDVKETVAPLPSRVQDHENRLRSIERQVWIWIGAAGVGGGGIATIVMQLMGTK